MELINKTPFQFAPIVGRLNFPKHSLTLIVKGTFDLKPGEKAVPAAEQLYPTGDEFYPDDDEQAGSLRYESDFAYFKPRADLLLAGKCYAPDGEPIDACRVTFRVGDKTGSLVVIGNRSWKRTVTGVWSITDPEPFTEMELRYENSYGGSAYKKNPVGKGYQKVTNKTKKFQPLPNIVDPDAVIDSPNSRVEPAGFGPLGRIWEHRHSRMGTYKGKYLKERWPWFPKNFDWTHFNAAPPEMQYEGYLNGDEGLSFEHLHPKHPLYESRLPGLRVRCFMNVLSGKDTDQPDFQEVAMKLDTLWVDTEAEKLVLLWRGWAEVQSEDFEEVQHVFVMSEPVDKVRQALEQCCELFLAALAEYEAQWAMAPEKPETPEELEEPIAPEEPKIGPPELAADAGAEAAAPIKKEALMKKVEAQTAAVFAQLGIKLDGLPPETLAKIEDQQDRIIKKLTEENPAKVMKMERAEMETQMEEAFSNLGIDINNPPPASKKAQAEQVRFMKELGLGDEVMMQDPELARFFAIMVAVLPKMGIDPENLDSLIAEANKQQHRMKKQLGIEEEEEKAAEKEVEEPPSGLTREIVEERAARGDSFAGEDLHGLDLLALDLQGLDFTGANLSRVSLAKSNLSAANLDGADMTGAVLAGALLSNANAVGSIFTSSDLAGANLEGASLQRADLSEATLTDAGLADADLSGANLTGAKLTGAGLTKANLSGATLTGANLSGSDLENADLTESDVTEGTLPDANLTGAIMNDAIFEKARMTNAVLDQVEAKDAYFTEADLSDADLNNADLNGADFSKCLLHGADFLGANLTEVNIYEAQGTKVNFREANLTGLRASEGCDFTEGCFVKTSGPGAIWQEAKLTGADFSFCNMEGADFSKASLNKAKLNAANIKYGRFIKASLREAKLLRMNLFEGSLEKADLTGADLRGSNLYGAEFLETVLDGTDLEGANVKMTKLAE